jgi:hypothetical protein
MHVLLRVAAALLIAIPVILALVIALTIAGSGAPLRSESAIAPSFEREPSPSVGSPLRANEFLAVLR